LGVKMGFPFESTPICLRVIPPRPHHPARMWTPFAQVNEIPGRARMTGSGEQAVVAIAQNAKSVQSGFAVMWATLKTTGCDAMALRPSAHWKRWKVSRSVTEIAPPNGLHHAAAARTSGAGTVGRRMPAKAGMASSKRIATRAVTADSRR